MQHIICSIIKLKHLSTVQIFVCSKENFTFFGNILLSLYVFILCFLTNHSAWLINLLIIRLANPSFFFFELIFKWIFELLIFRHINSFILHSSFLLFLLLISFKSDFSIFFFAPLIFHNFTVCFNLCVLSSHCWCNRQL